MGQLGIGLIGVGKHGIRYAKHIMEDLPDLRLVAISRRDDAGRQAAAEQFGCRGYADYRDLLAAPDVDVVAVVVPPMLHLEIIEAASAAGKPVLLEKPAVDCVDTGRKMLRAVRHSGVPVMVAQTLRYNGVVRAIQKALPRIGAIHGIRLGQRFEPSRPGWIDDPRYSGGGVTLLTGVHCFDLARLLTGMEADEAMCRVGVVGTVATDDNFAAVLRMGGGKVLATVAGSRATASRSGGIEVAGEKGQLIGDHTLNQACIVQGWSGTPLEIPEPLPTVREILTDFTDAVRRGRPMPIPLEEGLRAVAIIDACYRSAKSGRAEAVESIDPADGAL